MLDPYGPRHPDGPDDPEDLPGAPPMASISWLDDHDPFDDTWRSDARSDFRPHLEDPA